MLNPACMYCCIWKRKCVTGYLWVFDSPDILVIELGETSHLVLHLCHPKQRGGYYKTLEIHNFNTTFNFWNPPNKSWGRVEDGGDRQLEKKLNCMDIGGNWLLLIHESGIILVCSCKHSKFHRDGLYVEEIKDEYSYISVQFFSTMVTMGTSRLYKNNVWTEK